jgi:hypothetical protein
MLLSERITLSPRDVQRSSITVLYGPTPKVRSRSTYIALTTRRDRYTHRAPISLSLRAHRSRLRVSEGSRREDHRVGVDGGGASFRRRTTGAADLRGSDEAVCRGGGSRAIEASSRVPE